MFFVIVYALLKTHQTAPERKRNASEADKQQANKEQTIVIRTAGGSPCPAATRLLGKPGLLHTSHSAAQPCHHTRAWSPDQRSFRPDRSQSGPVAPEVAKCRLWWWWWWRVVCLWYGILPVQAVVVVVVGLKPGPSRASHFPRDMLLLTTTAREIKGSHRR